MKITVLHSCKKSSLILMIMLFIYVIASRTAAVNAEAATTNFDVSKEWGMKGTYTITSEGTIDLTKLPANAGSLNIIVSGSDASLLLFGGSSTTVKNLAITIKGGAAVTLFNVTIDNSTTAALYPVCAADDNANNRLIIWENNTLTGGAKSAGVNVISGCSLTIDSEFGFGDTCVLNANGGPGGAGIGGSQNCSAGNITILGGTVNAKGCGGNGYSGAGIGGGAQGHGGIVIIKGGIITATGASGGAGIGGGGLPHNIIASSNAAGVGGRVTIDGGTVVAYGSTTDYSGSAGIGGGAFAYWQDGAKGASVVINGGTVSAYGYGGGAGIGGACRGYGVDVTINGGIVNAICAGGFGAGIGGGGNSDYGGDGGSITINGGLVTASGSQIDIGCGGLKEQDKLACTYYITGGSVNARKVSNTPIVSDTDHTLLYYTEVSVPGIDSATKVTYSVDGGATSPTFTDENGMLYLWLPFKGDGELTNISVTTSKGAKSNMAVMVNPIASRWGKSGYLLLEESTTMDITELTPDAGNLTIIVSGSDTTLSLIGKSDVTYKNLCIRIQNGAKVIINNVSIYNWASRFDVIPIEADSNAGNTLYFSGTNTITSHSSKPGINVPEGSSLIISKVSSESESSSILNVYGGEEAAAIGARRFVNAGTITIMGGTVNAYGGKTAAGIGGGLEGKGGAVTIQGGRVTVIRGEGAPYDIGGGYKSKYGGANFFSGGSINLTYLGVEPYSSATGKPVYKTAIKIPDVNAVTEVRYKVDNSTELVTTTDNTGRIYPWLPTSATEVDIIAPGAYHYSGTIATNYANAFRMTDSGFAFTPVKTSYYMNEKSFQVAASGGKGSGAITYSSSDNTVATVTNSGEVTFKNKGEVTITAKRAADNYYHEVSAAVTITVMEPILQSIAITKPASKLEYIVGDSLDITGLEVTGTYSDNSIKLELVTAADITGFDSSKPAIDQVLTITVGEKTISYKVSIKEAPKPTPILQSIAITSPASKLEYIVGQSLDITGLVVTGTYSDNSTKLETVTAADVAGFDSTKPVIDQVLTITVGEKTVSYKVTIKEAPKPTPTLQSIAITKPASKLEYIVGQSLDITGLEVTGTYSDNTTKIEALAAANVTGFDGTKPAVDQVITITIGEKTATYKVAIKEAPKPTPTLQSIVITSPASKLEYIVGESIDITGLVVTGTYSDNSTKQETVTALEVSGFDSSKPVVDQVLTVNIRGKIATYKVTIKEASKPPVSAVISPVTVTYDLNNPGDVYTLITWNDTKAVDYVISDTVKLTTPNAYAVSGSALVIKNKYITSLELTQGGQAVFNITFDNGNTAVLTMNIVDGYIPGNDAVLDKLSVNNSTVSGFHPDTNEYFVELPYGTMPGNTASMVSAIPRDSKASVTITQAGSLPGDATVAITAEDKTTTKLYTVHFIIGTKPNSLTINAGPGGSISIGSNGNYEAGTVIHIVAIATAGYSFHGWTSTNGGSFSSSSNADTTFTMPVGDTVITASFTYNGDNITPAPIGGYGDNGPSKKDNKDEVSLANQEGVKGWKEIVQSLEKSKEDSLSVDMKSNTVVPGYILEALAKEDHSMAFLFEEGIEWTINSKDLREAAQRSAEGMQWRDMDLDIILNTDRVPAAQITELVNTYKQSSGLTEADTITPLVLSISHEGSFGFMTTLGINLGSANAGRLAYLFYYNPSSKKLVLQATGMINEKGQASFDLVHASDYVILTDNGDYIKAEMKKLVIKPKKKILYAGETTEKTTNMIISLPESLKGITENNSKIQTTYASSNSKVATVSSTGKIKALKEGKVFVTVTITINGISTDYKSRVIIRKAYISKKKNKKL